MSDSKYPILQIREDFPALNQIVNDKKLVFLDSSASSQKPKSMIDSITNHYTNNYANIHRGLYSLSENATNSFEKTRKTVQKFINAKYCDEIVFTKGATESINLVANSLAQFYFKKGDEIVISRMEHHANLVPWLNLEKTIGIVVKVAKLLEDGSLDISHFESLLSNKTKLVAISHCSNITGIITDVKKVSSICKSNNIPVLFDGAQAIMHINVDVQDLGCDFYVFSGHKLYGPTGLGVLYATNSWFEKMPPYQYGGAMVEAVDFDGGITYKKTSAKFEAGTQSIVEVQAFRESLDYITKIGMENIANHEQELLEYTLKLLKENISDITVLGGLEFVKHKKAAVITFNILGCHPNDIGMMLDTYGIAVRTGRHCAYPLVAFFKVKSTVRASFSMYNTFEEAKFFVESLQKVIKILK